MALRVLLADESVTIKKVIQLALQDFAVEVKAVPVGLDVLEVSKTFQPDLVFADVLLQKRSGYDVCRDLKKDAQTAAIPVILMWSSFMELDQKQVDACGADGRLEKPFEVETLRKMVLDLVPRTRSQRLATFLEFPATIAAPLKSEVVELAKNRPPPAERTPASGTLSGVDDNSGTFSTVVRAPAPKPPTTPPPGIPPKAVVTNENEMFEAVQTSSYVPSVPSRPIPPANKPQARPETQAKASSTETAPYSVVARKTATDEAVKPVKPKQAPPKDLELEPSPAPTEPPMSMNTDSSEMLGALPELLPDFKLEEKDSRWNMESFEPLDLAPLSLHDDADAEAEAFEPIRLPDTEAVPPDKLTKLEESPFAADDENEEAEAWSNKSLEKYRLAPLNPEEALADEQIDNDQYNVSSREGREGAVKPANTTPNMTDQARIEKSEREFEATPTPTRILEALDRSAKAPQQDLEKTVYLETPKVPTERPAKVSTYRYEQDDPAEDEAAEARSRERKPSRDDDFEDIREFSLSDADHNNMRNLEIELVDQADRTRPSIVRELLKDPDFTFDEDRAQHQIKKAAAKRNEAVPDLGSIGSPTDEDLTHTPTGRLEDRLKKPGPFFPDKSGAFGRERQAGASPKTGAPRVATLEERLAQEIEPHLERIVERVVLKLLPKIAEKIIQRELERLLEDS